ncbi:GMP synthase [Mesorhizobium sp. WSM4303]|uniref:type 1 glutamine amidotransferase n=1 Tax=unclassified Mesorhizobium TaxID=325217 RepID=UPI00115DA40A|nr:MULTISPECIES: type 1 glutamine amidotransferase [unclassified Mesorhizobium]TRC98252.1 GMP synthase [Mesorhizobium sp. WSM4306]TRD04229.1 GMP synthase [Mesorhizobium sp. WSM4303]
MRVLVVQNFDNEGLGQIGAALTEAGADIDLRKPYRGDTLPGTSNDHDAIVVLGGAQNALDDEICPYFPALVDLTRDFADKDRSVLGICLGSQLLARAFGGKNQIGGATEFGWHKVSLTPAAKSDPVLAALPQSFPIFEWHDDTFGLPENAVRLAGSAMVENQAFRLGRAAYGFQFHFEADTPMVRDWSASFAPLIAERHPHWQDRLDGEIIRNGPDADAAGLAIARAWVATI